MDGEEDCWAADGLVSRRVVRTARRRAVVVVEGWSGEGGIFGQGVVRLSFS